MQVDNQRYTTVRITRDVWKMVNEVKDLDETFSQTMQRIIQDRKRFKEMIADRVEQEAAK